MYINIMCVPQSGRRRAGDDGPAPDGHDASTDRGQYGTIEIGRDRYR